MVDLAALIRAVALRAWLVVAMVGAAILVALILFFGDPQRYRATADVVVPVQTTTIGSRIAAVDQAVSDFQGALRSSIVAQRLAEVAGLSIDEVSAHLESEQLFGASVVEVGFEGTDPDIAEEVVGAASREALVVLLEAQLGPIQQVRDLAQDTSDRLDGEYVTFLQTNNILVPDEVFARQDRRMQELQDAIGNATAAGERSRANELREQLERVRDKWTPLKAEWDSLQQARFRANQSLSEAESAYNTAQAALDAAEEGTSTAVAAAVPVPRVPQLLRRILTVAVLATGLAIALIAGLELLARGASRPAPSTARPRGTTEGPVRIAGAAGDGGRPSPTPGSAQPSSKEARRRRRHGSGSPQAIPNDDASAARSRERGRTEPTTAGPDGRSRSVARPRSDQPG